MLHFILIIIFTIFISAIIVLDLTKKIPVINKGYMSIYLALAPHIILLGYLINQWAVKLEMGLGFRIILIFELCVLTLYIWARLNINPKKSTGGSTRVTAMMGGRTIILCGLYTLLIQTILTIGLFEYVNEANIPSYIIITDVIIAILDIIVLLYNGSLRIFCTSKRLGIVKRLVLLFTAWVPILNVVMILYACRIVKLEYDHECYKVVTNNERVESQICATKYPLIMVHGIGFRDLKYINYWGRIPKQLIKNGSKVYYGNQEAWGTVEDNANDIKEKIFEILKENNCKKVNIIAHSKGGLDARYMISELEMGEYVASLTTISTPHKGSGLLDILCKLPDSAYRKLCRVIDKYFGKLGDKNPDAYTASRQLAPTYAKEFNEKIVDVQNIYYQSYASVMRGFSSHLLLCIPYLMMKPVEGENDGLVGIESAKWGEFKGVIRNKHHRGISHGDMIDLKREDYKGFDVVEKYVEIVSELKEMGY